MHSIVCQLLFFKKIEKKHEKLIFVLKNDLRSLKQPVQP